jgi:RHS repeat-associated protein
VALLPAGSTAQFYAEDMLGSSRIVTTNTGAVCYDADFYPYGGERTYINSCLQNNYKFEGKERDTETGNDDFGARYYSYRFGRWLSADWSNVPVAVPYANLTNPQTLNLYAMVNDNPESFADLDGHDLVVAAELQTVVTQLRNESPSFNAELKAYEGPNAPNLTIKFGATPNDPSGAPTIGSTDVPLVPSPVVVNIPPGPDEDGTVYSLPKNPTTTITISNTISNNKDAVEDTTKHEVGHAHDARTDTNRYGHDSTKTSRTKGKTPHDDRREERKANEFKDKVNKEQKEWQKEHCHGIIHKSCS